MSPSLQTAISLSQRLAKKLLYQAIKDNVGTQLQMLSVFCKEWPVLYKRLLYKTMLVVMSLLGLMVQSNAAAAFGFLPEQQVLKTLPALEQKAQQEQKLLLLVLGANWCHDSVALLQRFNEPAMSEALQQRFAMAFVDVGYLESGAATAARYRQPLYYGTPTVLIIAPDSGQLLNKADVMHWTNAASLTLPDYQQYFLQRDFVQQFAETERKLAGINPLLLQQIDQFEQQQAATLALAYQQLGPLLKAYKESGQAASAEFKLLWDKIKTFRSSILPEVQQLQQQASQLAQGESLRLPKAATAALWQAPVTAKP